MAPRPEAVVTSCASVGESRWQAESAACIRLVRAAAHPNLVPRSPSIRFRRVGRDGEPNPLPPTARKHR
eukprot:scaffold305414_cov36-Tisochrysis_lutea.AAC.1